MLQPDGVGAAAVDGGGGGGIGFGIVGVDRRHDVGIVRLFGIGAHRIDVDADFGMFAPQMIVDVGGIGRDPATPRPETADQRDAAGAGMRPRGRRFGDGVIVVEQASEEAVLGIIFHGRPSVRSPD